MRASLAALAALILAGACGGASPSRELVSARQAYERASRSRAAEYTPASVLSARQALERAEREFEESPGSDKERSYAYVALRRAELAVAEGDAAYERAERQRAEAEYVRVQEQMATAAQDELEASQERVETLEGEAAEARRALEELKALGQVKEDERGTVLMLSGQILFRTGSAELLPASREALTKVAQVLAGGTQPVVIEGHADARGNEKANQELSMRRAEAVRSFLIEQGVEPERLTAVGYGETRAIASNDTTEGRALNRRVEIVLGKPGTERLEPASGRRPPEEQKQQQEQRAPQHEPKGQEEQQTPQQQTPQQR